MRQHEPAVCIRDVAGTQYVGNGWRSKFTCPACSRSSWQHLNFLGQRSLICDGVRFSKETGPTEPTWRDVEAARRAA